MASRMSPKTVRPQTAKPIGVTPRGQTTKVIHPSANPKKVTVTTGRMPVAHVPTKNVSLEAKHFVRGPQVNNHQPHQPSKKMARNALTVRRRP